MIKQFKTNENHNSTKLHLDKYYTSDKLAKYCVDKTLEVIGEGSITEFIEPSAGSGAFLNHLPPSFTKGYDLEPEDSRVIKQDFLELDLDYKVGRCFIGNPPYGSKLNLAKSFCNKSFDKGDFVSFILPISQLNNTQSIYKFDLLYSEDLGKTEYSTKKVHCCLNIYKRPKEGLNKRKNYKDSEIIEIREVIDSSNKKRCRDLGDFDYDFGICSWGSVGKVCTEGEYGHTCFIKIKDINNFSYYRDLILDADWIKLYNLTNSPALYQWQVYKYVEDNSITTKTNKNSSITLDDFI